MSRRAHPALLASAAVLAVFWRPLLRDGLVGADMTACFEPLARVLADGIRHGNVLRTPLLFAGMPLLAHPVSATAYPPQWIVALLDPSRAVAVLSVLHLALATAGTAMLLRRAGRSPFACVAGAVALGFGGVASSSMLQPNLLRALAWTPLVLAQLADATDPQPRRRTFVALALCTTMLLLTAEPFVVLPAAIAVAVVLVARRARGGRWRAAVAMAAGAALAAPLLLPAALHVGSSVRAAGFVAEGVHAWSLHPAQALGFLLPHPFGWPGMVGVNGFAASSLLGGRSGEYFVSCYLGSCALGLAVAGLVEGRRLERACGVALALLLLLALGSHGPLQPLLDAAGVDWLRYPAKWLLPAALPFAVLVARGADALAASSRTARGALVVAAAVAAAFASFAGPLSERIAAAANGVDDAMRERLAEGARQRLLHGAAWSAAIAIGLLAVAALLERRGLGSRVAPAAALLLLLDLGAVARGSIVTARPEAPPPTVAALRDDRELARAWVDPAVARHPLLQRPHATLGDARTERLLLECYAPALDRVALALPTDVEALRPLRLDQVADLLAHVAWRERLMILGAAGVTHVVTFEPDAGPLASEAREIDVGADVPLRVLRNAVALPRIRLVPTVVIHDDAAGFAEILQRSPGDFFAHATLVSGVDWRRAERDASPPSAAPASWTGGARLVEERAGSLRIATSGGGGCLVVSDAFLPGLRATIDAADAPVLPADHAFTGVVVPPGDHEVIIRYCPWRT